MEFRPSWRFAGFTPTGSRDLMTVVDSALAHAGVAVLRALLESALTFVFQRV